MHRLFLILGLVVALAIPAAAQEAKNGYGPAIPKATGNPHPEGNDYMRRWHMTMMSHDRDITVYRGERGLNASLGACFECHTVRDSAGTPVTYSDERHFCRVCHDYAAVKVDCFDCHRSTPADFDESAQKASLGGDATRPQGDAETASLRAYLRSHEVTQ